MTDHVDVLQKAREQMIKARRDLADGLSKPYDGRTPDLRKSFIEVQATITRIDDAIADEQKNAPRAAPKGFGGDDGYKPYS